VRRIEAVTGRGALDWISVREGLLSRAAEALKAAPAEVPERVAALVEERRRLERELEDLRRKAALGGGSGGQGIAPVTVDGVSFVSRLLDDVPGKDLKGIADDLMRQIGSGVVALASSFEGKASLVVAVSPDLASRFNAVDLVRAGSSVVGGKGGGGRPDMAQAGGPDGAASGAALDAIRSSLAG
jgi:alanyl-tRNA synthetase